MGKVNWQGKLTHSAPALWNGHFLRSDVEFLEASRKDWVESLAREMLGFRFALSVEDSLFEAYALSKGFSENDAKSIWKSYKELPMKTSSSLPPKSNPTTTGNASRDRLIESFETYRSGIIKSNMPSGKKADLIRVGSVGELLALVFLRDLEPCDCTYHKLTPDNPSMPRHGLDLVGVKFSSNPEKDLVILLEAKATASRITSARDEIVDWFNLRLASRVNMTLESAKIEWEKSYSRDVWKRAVTALCRYQAGNGDYSYVGTVTYDVANRPTDHEVAGFSLISVPSQSKLVVFIALSRIDETASEVFRQCLI